MSHQRKTGENDSEMSPALTNSDIRHSKYSDQLLDDANFNIAHLKKNVFNELPYYDLQEFVSNGKKNGHKVVKSELNGNSEHIITLDDKNTLLPLTPQPAHERFPPICTGNSCIPTEDLSTTKSHKMCHLLENMKPDDPITQLSPPESVKSSHSVQTIEPPPPVVTPNLIKEKLSQQKLKTIRLIKRLRWMQQAIANQQIQSGLSSVVNEKVVPSTSGASCSRIAVKNQDIFASHSKAVCDRLQDDVDSEATVSSSGAETEDEDLDVRNKITRKKHHGRKWIKERADTAFRWTWLQAQVSDLEYKIRQHGEIHRKLRATKPQAVNVTSLVTESDTSLESSLRSARCLPYARSTLQSRSWHKFTRVSSAPAMSDKGRKKIVVRCQCEQTKRQCAICAGHHNYALPHELDLVSYRERAGLIDPCFHPVLSTPADIDPGMEMETVMSDKQVHSTVSMKKIKKLKKLEKAKKHLTAQNGHIIPLLSQTSGPSWKKSNKKKYIYKKKKSGKSQRVHNTRIKRAHNTNVKEQDPAYPSDESYDSLDEEFEQLGFKTSNNNSKRTTRASLLDKSQSASQHVDNKDSSLKKVVPHKSRYEIDDIVIPYHIAATTRVEKLQYKEIDTPRWREVPGNITSVHEMVRSSTSMPPTPITPITPIITVSSSKDITTVIVPPPNNNPISTSSTVEEEDLSESHILTRHERLEEREKSRYLNFVTGGTRQRPRTNSTAEHTLSLPLTEETTPQPPAKRLRTASLSQTAHRSELPSPDIPRTLWTRRVFPLTGEDEKYLDSAYTEPMRPQTERRDDEEEWKVVINSADAPVEKAPLVLKLSKSHTDPH